MHTSVRVRGAHVKDSCPFATDLTTPPAVALRWSPPRQQACAPQEATAQYHGSPNGFYTGPVPDQQSLMAHGGPRDPYDNGMAWPGQVAFSTAAPHNRSAFDTGPAQHAQHATQQSHQSPPPARDVRAADEAALQRSGAFMGAMSQIRAGPSDAQRAHAEQNREQMKHDLEAQVRLPGIFRNYCAVRICW